MSTAKRQFEDLSFEEAMDSLESIVSSLEDQQLSLEDMVSSYEDGMKLLKVCRARIDRAQKRVESIQINIEKDLKVSTVEFDSQEHASEVSLPPADEIRKKTKKKSVAEEPNPDDEIRLF